MAETNAFLNSAIERENHAEILKEALELSSNDFLDKKSLSLEDITDEMILNRNIFSFSSFSLINITLSIPNGYQREMKYFNGIDDLYSLQSEKDTKIQIKYQPKEKENYKLVFIYPNDTIVELSEDSTEYFLPAGKTKITLIGIKANGSFKIQINPQENIKINKI